MRVVEVVMGRNEITTLQYIILLGGKECFSV